MKRRSSSKWENDKLFKIGFVAIILTIFIILPLIILDYPSAYFVFMLYFFGVFIVFGFIFRTVRYFLHAEEYEECNSYFEMLKKVYFERFINFFK